MVITQVQRQIQLKIHCANQKIHFKYFMILQNDKNKKYGGTLQLHIHSPICMALETTPKVLISMVCILFPQGYSILLN